MQLDALLGFDKTLTREDIEAIESSGRELFGDNTRSYVEIKELEPAEGSYELVLALAAG